MQGNNNNDDSDDEIQALINPQNPPPNLQELLGGDPAQAVQNPLNPPQGAAIGPQQNVLGNHAVGAGPQQNQNLLGNHAAGAINQGLDNQEQQGGFLFNPVIGHAQNLPNAVQQFIAAREHLLNLDGEEELIAIINHHPHIPAFDHVGMTVFQRLARALLEEGGPADNRHLRYDLLIKQCAQGVTPDAILAIPPQNLVGMRIGGQLRAQVIRNLATSFQVEGEAENLLNMGVEQVLTRLRSINFVGEYRAFCMMLFGLGTLNFVPMTQRTFRYRLNMVYPAVDGGVPDPEDYNLAGFAGWNPFSGLGSWYIWTYARQ